MCLIPVGGSLLIGLIIIVIIIIYVFIYVFIFINIVIIIIIIITIIITWTFHRQRILSQRATSQGKQKQLYKQEWRVTSVW